ncbi:MAG: 8-oxo-dGTP diphosphatase [Kiritimatiellae bacterium]|nr:8-oxo-dGTP diphosphatase [Kiritimatiellia bacterium]
MNAELCNMCMVMDNEGRVLVQERLPKPTNPWCGLTFPGGHLEHGESIVESTIREMNEETGLIVSNLQNCGFVQWYNPAKDLQYIVFLFKTNTYTGTLKDSAEGNVRWMTLDEMRSGNLAPNMDRYIDVILNDNLPQVYGVVGSGLTSWEG